MVASMVYTKEMRTVERLVALLALHLAAEWGTSTDEVKEELSVAGLGKMMAIEKDPWMVGMMVDRMEMM